MKKLIPALLVLVAVSACDSGDSTEEVDRYFQVQLRLDGLSALDGGAAYEAWALINQNWTSIARFNYDLEGRIVDTGGRLIANTFITDFDMAGAAEILVTVEDRRDADLIPSATRVLHGDVVGSGAALTFESAVADLSAVQASYTIGTPTDSDPNNEAFGVWLGTPGTYQQAMTAPVLSPGWGYELWIQLAEPVSLGKFSDPGSRDESARFSSTPELFGVPGEDLLHTAPQGQTFPLAVAGHRIFVTLEPTPDDFEATPYGIRVLEADIPSSAQPGTALQMSVVNQVPSGTAQFR